MKISWDVKGLQKEGKSSTSGCPEVSVSQMKCTETCAIVKCRTATACWLAELKTCWSGRKRLGSFHGFHGNGQLSAVGTLGKNAEQAKMTPSQLRWRGLLRRSPVMLPIPGTSQVAHLEENVATAAVKMMTAHFRNSQATGKAKCGRCSAKSFRGEQKFSLCAAPDGSDMEPLQF